MIRAFEQLVRGRRAVDKFLPNKPIDLDIIKKCIALAQPYKILVVDNVDIKERVSECMLDGNIKKTKDCSALILFLADSRPQDLVNRIKELEIENGTSEHRLTTLHFNVRYLASSSVPLSLLKSSVAKVLSITSQPTPSVNTSIEWSFKNTMMAAQTFLLAVESYGLSSCPMEGYDESRTKSVLGIPSKYRIPLAVAVGYCDIESSRVYGKSSVRLPMSEVSFSNFYGKKLL